MPTDLDLLTAAVPAGSRLRGQRVAELRLPPPAGCVLVIRDGIAFVPDRDTVLRTGDELVLAAPTRDREAVTHRLRGRDPSAG